MKDLDFDELDRAVNSLMEGVSRSAPEPPKSQEKVITITPSTDNSTSFKQAPPSTEQVSSAAPVAASPSNPSPIQASTSSGDRASRLKTSASGRSSQLPARRNGGRFMDVVHPSSNMKTLPQSQSRTVSRQGVTISPSNHYDSSASSTYNASPASPSQPAPANLDVSSVQADSDWPDPIDVLASKEELPATGVQAPDRDQDTVAEAAKSLSKESTNSSNTSSYDPAPLQTPFLADPKVEKRPLGGFASNLHDTVDSKDSLPQITPLTSNTGEFTADLRAEKQTIPDPKLVTNTDLPDELRHDVMAIEADTSSDASEQKQITEAVPAPEAEPHDQGRSRAATETNDTTPATALSTGPSSIAQQYRQEPSTNESAHGGIYDTDSYHQPLAHPEHKKSGWLVVIWVALLLLLGGGGAAAMYYLGII